MSHELIETVELTDCGGAPLPAATPIPTVANFKASPGTNSPLSLVVWTSDDDCPNHLTAPSDCNPTSKSVYSNNTVLGANEIGQIAFMNMSHRITTYSFGTYDPQANQYDVLNLQGTDLVLLNPTNICGQQELWIRNADGIDHTVTLDLDGTVGKVLTLTRQETGLYPFSDNGGDSIHLVWNSAGPFWSIITSHTRERNGAYLTDTPISNGNTINSRDADVFVYGGSAGTVTLLQPAVHSTNHLYITNPTAGAVNVATVDLINGATPYVIAAGGNAHFYWTGTTWYTI